MGNIFSSLFLLLLPFFLICCNGVQSLKCARNNKLTWFLYEEHEHWVWARALVEQWSSSMRIGMSISTEHKHWGSSIQHIASMQLYFCFGWLESSEFLAPDDELGILIHCKLINCTDIAFNLFCYIWPKWKTKRRKN